MLSTQYVPMGKINYNHSNKILLTVSIKWAFQMENNYEEKNVYSFIDFFTSDL
jgi:hypothetical protein